MKSYLILLSSLALAGCISSPFKTSFPTPPEKIMVKPDEMVTFYPVNVSPETLEDSSPSEVQLSTLIKKVSTNYKTCNEYKEQVNSLQDWITQQQKINP